MPSMIDTSRGCGERHEGGIYLESATSPYGQPLEQFLLDPPIPVDRERDKITPIGIELIQAPDGITHILDWIGESNYPYPSDFLEEGRRKGFSRRVSHAVEFWRLTPYVSRIYAVHANGFVMNWREYARGEYAADGSDPEVWRHCRRYTRMGDNAHILEDPIESCSRYAWAAAPSNGEGEHGPMRSFVDFEYRVFPVSGVSPSYAPAIIASLPVTNITVIAARDGSHLETVERLRRDARQMHVHIAPS